MIPLHLRTVSSGPEPFIARLNAEERTALLTAGGNRTLFDVELTYASSNRVRYSGGQGEFELFGVDPGVVDGDVLLVLPGDRGSHRLIRANSPHNTFLTTERCDQLCVMCSQPPKRHHMDLFPYFEAAALLAPTEATIGLSGGEPMLHKRQVFDLLSRVLAARLDLGFHVLTNGQHFAPDDGERLIALPNGRVHWGVPLYSHRADVHDQIVGKEGAFARLMDSMGILCREGASIELRTVVVTSNERDLVGLAQFVVTQLAFVNRWAIMQLENIGYGRKNWQSLFFDNSRSFEAIGDALDIVRSRGIDAVLYNFPRCTVPLQYRHLALPSISDWKRDYLEPCEGCRERDLCGGFFAWHPRHGTYRNLGLA